MPHYASPAAKTIEAGRLKGKEAPPTSNNQKQTNALMSNALFQIAREDFQNTLEQANVKEDTIADLQVNNIVSANQLLFACGGNVGRYIDANDYVNLTNTIGQLLSVQCGQGAAMDEDDRDNLATICMVMPELAKREKVKMLNNVSAVPAHMCEQFPSDLSSTEQKQDFSIGRMITEFGSKRPGVLKPSSRPANNLLNSLLQFALTKAGYKQNLYALTAHQPNFARLAMKAGASEESVGGNANLYTRRDGGEVEPRSIGAVGQLWSNFLKYAQAMFNVAMPDGTVYGQEAGFVVLDECYAEYASQRKNVAAVCGALSAGWQTLCDELVTSSDNFVTICRNMKKAGVWVEHENTKRKGEDTNSEFKRLKAELTKLQQERSRSSRGGQFGGGQYSGGQFSGNQLNNNNGWSFNNNNGPPPPPGGGQVQSNKPCFDYFAGLPCTRKPCPFRHYGEPPAYNPAKKPTNKG